MSEAAWVQFNPWPAKGDEAKGPRPVNTVTLFCLAKKIMAQEWRRARGITKRDPRLIELEKSAMEYKARRIKEEQEEQRKAEQICHGSLRPAESHG